MRAIRYCFTLNNYSPQEEQHIADTATNNADIRYLVFGRETGASGTPHLQGFVVFTTRKTVIGVKSILGARLHLEVTRAVSSQAADYCKKDGDFSEFGTIPADNRGRRTDWDDYREWVIGMGRVPSTLEIAREFPSLYARYSGACITIAQASLPVPRLVSTEPTLHGWQQALFDALEQDCEDDRSILFYVDEEGNNGKSFFCRYMLDKMPERVQVLGIGRVTDLAFQIDPEKDIFLIDIERSASDFLQYRVLEQLKNRMVNSTKYHAVMKILRKIPHVVVFMNERPDMTKLSADRYIVTEL